MSFLVGLLNPDLSMSLRFRELVLALTVVTCEVHREMLNQLAEVGILTDGSRPQPWQLQKRLQTMLPAASLRHRSGWRPGTVSALAQQCFFARESKNLCRSSLSCLDGLGGDEAEDELIYLSLPLLVLVLLLRSW
nr:hypothetical protein Iba_chr09eCG10440 [Ipomoea batatas]